MTFIHHVTVRLFHTDAATVIFYGRLFDITQECFEMGLLKAGFPLGGMLRQRDYLLPVVHAEVDFRAPMRVGDQLECRCSLTPGGRSVRLDVEIHNGEEIAASAAVVHAAIDLVSGRSITVPLQLRTALEG